MKKSIFFKGSMIIIFLSISTIVLHEGIDGMIHHINRLMKDTISSNDTRKTEKILYSSLYANVLFNSISDDQTSGSDDGSESSSDDESGSGSDNGSESGSDDGSGSGGDDDENSGSSGSDDESGGGFDPFALPIELASYSAVAQNNSVKLEWATSTEINNDYFTIERSSNGLTYELVATIKGAGTSSNVNEYVYSDEMPLSGTSYYKLTQTDLDGTTKDAGLVAVVIEDESTECTMQIVPNPCPGRCDIKLTGCDNKDFVQIGLYDSMGREIRSTVPIKQGNGFYINTSNNLAPGTYIVFGATLNQKMNQKVIVN